MLRQKPSSSKSDEFIIYRSNDVKSDLFTENGEFRLVNKTAKISDCSNNKLYQSNRIKLLDTANNKYRKSSVITPWGS